MSNKKVLVVFKDGKALWVVNNTMLDVYLDVGFSGEHNILTMLDEEQFVGLLTDWYTKNPHNDLNVCLVGNEVAEANAKYNLGLITGGDFDVFANAIGTVAHYTIYGPIVDTDEERIFNDGEEEDIHRKIVELVNN